MEPVGAMVPRSHVAWLRHEAWLPLGPEAREEQFAALALERFAAQARSIAAYGAYVRHLGLDPAGVRDWRAIPPVPASAFKSHDLASSASGSERVSFETSGTTISRPGRVRLADTAGYETSLLESFQRHLLPDGKALPAVVFGPARAEAPRSSLWFMADVVVTRLATGGVWIVRDGLPDWDLADRTLASAEGSGAPVLLIGTTLLLMACAERLEAAGRSTALPPGSRVMDTGGAKGLRAEFTRAEVEEALDRALGIPPTHLVNEYGMAELGSQFYDDSLRAYWEERPALPGKQIPPWVRTRVLDPETLEERPEGERGLLVHYDLANVETPFAVQTEDVGARLGDRVRLEGRLSGAEARGCSLTFERFLERESAGRAPGPERNA
jgi:acyl-protein synthetase LuxE